VNSADEGAPGLFMGNFNIPLLIIVMDSIICVDIRFPREIPATKSYLVRSQARKNLTEEIFMSQSLKWGWHFGGITRDNIKNIICIVISVTSSAVLLASFLFLQEINTLSDGQK
jgi:hypothetical protein